MNLKQTWQMIKSAASSWVDDYAPSMGAALAYYTVFSIAPLLLIVISVAGLVFGADAARGEIVSQLQGMMGVEAAKAIEDLLVSVSKPSEGILATVIGLVVLLIGATTVFGELQDALDRIWRAPARKTSGLWGLLRARVLSFGMILGVGFLLMASLVISAGLSALGKWWAPAFGGWEVLAQVFNFTVSFGLVTVIFAMIYKIMPRVRIQWRDVWVGAAVTSLLFTVGKFLIGLYVGKSGVASGFGAAGSLVVLLVWVYYSAQVFLMGAEFTWVYAHTFGSMKDHPQEGAAPAIPTQPETAGGSPVPATAAEPDNGSSGAHPSGIGAVVAARAAAPADQPETVPDAAAAGLQPALQGVSLPQQAADYVRRRPMEGVGLAVASGVALRVVLGIGSRLLRNRLR